MFDGKYYQEMLGITEKDFISKPIKLSTCAPSSLIKTNSPLILSHLVYKFLVAEENILIPPIIHKPEEVIEALETNNKVIDLGQKFGKIVFSKDKIYGIIFCKKNMAASQVASTITHGYDIFSQLLVRCKIRFISRDPVYVVFERNHGPEIVVSLRDLISKYGITNDSLYSRRLDKIFSEYIKKQHASQGENNDDQRT